MTYKEESYVLDTLKEIQDFIRSPTFKQLIKETHENNIMLRQIVKVINTHTARHHQENEDDIYDYYEFYYPFATYVWQGGVIHKGMLFMPVGNSNKTKCLFVFDIYNHSLKALINLDAFMAASEEPEDADVYKGELYIAMYAGASATSSKAMKKIKFL